MSRRLVFLTCIFATVALAQDDADQEASTESATEQSAEEVADEEALDEAVSDDDFIPTKEVAADQEVNFPVDI